MQLSEKKKTSKLQDNTGKILYYFILSLIFIYLLVYPNWLNLIFLKHLLKGVVQQNEIVRETTPLPPNIPTARIEETSKLQNNTGENEEKDEEKGIVQRLKNSLLKVKV